MNLCLITNKKGWGKTKRAIALFILVTTTAFGSLPFFVSQAFAQITSGQSSNSNAQKSSTGTTGQTSSQSGNLYTATPVSSQSAAYIDPSKQTNGSSTQPAQYAGDAIACAAGTILANMLSSAISSAFNSAINTVVRDEAVGRLTTVPTTESGSLRYNVQGQTSAHSGQFTYGGIYIGIGWDGIAWCIVNEMIDYIAEATIAWANSGFNGNPAFIDNPDAFFKDLADNEAAGLIQSIAYVEGGIDVCKPFRVKIAVNLSDVYGKQANAGGSINKYGGSLASCRLSDIERNIDQTTGRLKEWNPQDFFELSMNDNSNIMGTYIEANKILNAQISAKQNTAQLNLNLNNGFLSRTKCEDPKKPETCKVTTPGTVIQTSLEKSLNLPKDRLVLAQKFDQVVSAIINNLIKVALDKVLTNE